MGNDKNTTLRALLTRWRIWEVERKGILVESLLFVVVYIVLQMVLSVETPLRGMIENLAILVSSLTAAVLIFHSLPGIVSSARPAWIALAGALFFWALSDFAQIVSSLLSGSSPAQSLIVLILRLLAYSGAAYAFIRFPPRENYAPSRFRFILDAVISSLAVATLGYLMLARPALTARNVPIASLISIFGAPVADLVLLVILFNASLSSTMTRTTSLFLGFGLFLFAISDFAASSLALLDYLRPGGLVGVGWVSGALLMGAGAVFEAANRKRENTSTTVKVKAIGIQFQNVLPIALVLVLFWYVFMDWRLRGGYSSIGVWMSISMGILLIVRLGIRAGETELNKYWQLFKNLADPAFICDETGKVLLSNPAFRQLTDAQMNDQSLLTVFSGIDPEIITSIVRKDASIEVEIEAQKDKNPYLLSLSPIITERRQPLIAGAAHNLKEQKRQRDAIQSAFDELQTLHHQLEELNSSLERKVGERTATLQEAYSTLEAQNRALQALDQLKSDFVSMVSHELRTPLNNLGGGLELLLTKKTSQSAAASTLSLMQAEVQRLTRFVENILNVSAIEAGRIPLRRERVSLDMIFKTLKEKWGDKREAERINVHISKGLPDVTVDQGALESVLTHLLDNAIKYAPEGPVQLSAERYKRRVRVRVRDVGPGIPPEKRHLLFERFQRLDTKDSQSVYGYGLGLYFSRRLLQAMDSDLIFDAPSDGGARFSFTLRIARK